MTVLNMSNKSWYDLFQVHSVFTGVSLHNDSHTSADWVKTCYGSSWYLRLLESLWLQEQYVPYGLLLVRMDFNTLSGNTVSKKGMLVHLKWHLSWDLHFVSAYLQHSAQCSYYGVHHCCHSPQAIWQQQFQIHLEVLWIFCPFYSGRYHLLGLLQMVVVYICNYQIDNRMQLGMMTSHQVLSCSCLSLHE